MRLYSGMSKEFILDTTRNQIADKLQTAFFAYYRYKASHGEVGAWRNSLRAMAQILQHAQLLEHGVMLEYQLPLSSKRLDCLVCGRDAHAADQAVIVELKQWDRCSASDADKLVVGWVGGGERELLHPSVQVGQYQQYLQDTHTAFHDGADPVSLRACAYLHNSSAEEEDAITAPKFEAVVRDYPMFLADGADALSAFLYERLSHGSGRPVLDRVERSAFRPSKKLMEHVSATIRSKPPWILLDEQLVVFEKILALAQAGVRARKKQVVIVRGGPGTGKSVLAINLVAELYRRSLNAHYATGSKAFTETLREIVGSRSHATFKYFNSYGSADPDGVDVLICDEAHRVRETSNQRFTPKAKRTNKPQLHELLDAAKVSVFFIDDRQGVRPNEIGSSEFIRAEAKKRGCGVAEHELEVQFRCAGSDGFVKWIDNTLGVAKTANVLWDGADGFDFRILESPESLERAIGEKVALKYSARVAAGFCWIWSHPRSDGSLVDDVVIGDYKRPWNARHDSAKLAPGVPPASLWATDPRGLQQIGCIYTIQGFELDFVGVIWGKDLIYDFDRQSWVGDKKQSADSVVKRSKGQFVDLVKNTYRVLLSRGLKGCYVHFLDKDTERFVRSRMEARSALEDLPMVAEERPRYGDRD